VRADAEAYRVERKTAPNADTWETIASFAIHAGDCR